eukprot:scaffold6798_cov172-Alexandrium_tamarense.AAC.1
MNPALTSLPSHYLLSLQTLPQDRVCSVEPPINEKEYHRWHSWRSDGARRVLRDRVCVTERERERERE